jgi:hypothetical protein
LRISKSDDPQHAAISHALHTLVGQGVRLCYTSQTLGEFWNASTRPLDKNGFGLSVAETDRLARVIERYYKMADEREVPLCALLELALDALEKKTAPEVDGAAWQGATSARR